MPLRRSRSLGRLASDVDYAHDSAVDKLKDDLLLDYPLSYYDRYHYLYGPNRYRISPYSSYRYNPDLRYWYWSDLSYYPYSYYRYRPSYCYDYDYLRGYEEGMRKYEMRKSSSGLYKKEQVADKYPLTSSRYWWYTRPYTAWYRRYLDY